MTNDSQTFSGITKVHTGIAGFDVITGGGLPQGRPSLVVGGAGAGKTLFAMEFLVHGALEYNDPGVFFAFEENAEELAQNVASLGFDLKGLEAAGRIPVDHIRIERSEIEETGEYDLEGLFIRIGLAIDTIGAKRVVLDTIEALFSGLSNGSILRAELRRLFRWLKDKGVTTVITAEQGSGKFTRQGMEEYVSDAVIFLDHRIENQLSTRRLRVVKYRGSSHGTNEYPFLIGKDGFEILPITSFGLKHVASSEPILTGVARLDTTLGGQDFIAVRPCSFLAPPAAVRAALLPIFPAPPANAERNVPILPSRNPRARSSVICARLGSTWNLGSGTACCVSMQPVRRSMGWKYTWPGCIK